jgi:hypothetical protein
MLANSKLGNKGKMTNTVGSPEKGSNYNLVRYERACCDLSSAFARLRRDKCNYLLKRTSAFVGFIGALTNLHFCECCKKMRPTT